MDRLNRWLTLIANLGVLMGILILAFEIRQNTLALQATAIQESVSRSRETLLMFATDPEVNRIEMIGGEDPSKLSSEELRRYGWIIRSYWMGNQGLYRQWELGVLPNEEWRVQKTIICTNFSAPGMQMLWPSNRRSLIPAFVKLVEEECQVTDDYVGPEGIVPQD